MIRILRAVVPPPAHHGLHAFVTCVFVRINFVLRWLWQEATKLFAKLKGLLEQDEGAECAVW